MDSAFASESPTSSEPMSPGPWVTATASIPDPEVSEPARSRASASTGVRSSRWARPASSGTTPP